MSEKNTEAARQAAEAVTPFLAERFVGREDFASISTRLDEIAKQVSGFPAIVSADTKERDKAGKETSLSRLVYAKWFRKKHQIWPTERIFSPEVAYLQRALDTGTAGAGSELVPEEWASEIIENLRAQAVVFAAGPRIVPMRAKKLHFGSLTAGTTYQWLGEGVASTESTPTTSELVLDLSTARGLQFYSIEFVREAGPSIDAAVRADLVEGLRTFVDDGLLEGSGASRPTGMDAITGINSIGADSDNANGGELNADDLKRADQELNIDNAPARRVFFMHPRVWGKVTRLKDADGRYLVGDLSNSLNRQLLGYPVFLSTEKSIAETKGTGTSLSTALLVAMDEIVVGVGEGGQGVELAVSDDARFTNAQIAVRVLFRVDLKARHATSICEIDGVK